ncbi:MAG: hypothetical protein MR512_01305 [Anaerococcus sp.]|nr:hypothetical protein [Anaerococcus sp.]
MLGLVLTLTSCGEEVAYQKQDIELREGEPSYVKEAYALGLPYELIEDSELYEDEEAKRSFEKLAKGSLVKILGEAEGDLILVDYNGLRGYVDKTRLKEI